MMAAAKWVSFDCFGTLIDWQSGFRRVLASMAGDRVDQLVRAYHEAEAGTQSEDLTRPYRDVLTSTLSKAADSIGLTLSPTQAKTLVTEWGSHPIFPDTLPALREMHADGWKVAILTNCDADLFAATLPIFAGQVDMVITSAEVKDYKPGLGHFNEFEKRTGVARDRWVHAAVSWWHDMRPAKLLGIRGVWVDREHTGQDDSICTAHIHDMASLPGTLRSFSIA
jgi:2-haloacid dehalogenase